jgi:hypothetical protein
MTSAPATAPLTFDQFWRWLSEHRDCVVRAGTEDLMLFDHELMHWDFFEEAEGRGIVQLIFGKTLVGELMLERSEVLFVQSSPNVEEPKSGEWFFECLGGPRDESYPLFVFVMSHGMEGVADHSSLKH